MGLCDDTVAGMALVDLGHLIQGVEDGFAVAIVTEIVGQDHGEALPASNDGTDPTRQRFSRDGSGMICGRIVSRSRLMSSLIML